jgi:integrase/recombinase XerD
MLEPQTPALRLVHAGFAEWLHAVGYRVATSRMLLACTAEWLHRLEALGFASVDDLRQLEPRHVRDHHHYLLHRPRLRGAGGLSGSMLNHHLYSIRTLHHWLVATGRLPHDPTGGLDLPRLPSAVRTLLSETEVNALWAAVDTPFEGALLALAYGCGLRRAEIAALDVGDFHPTAVNESGTATVYVRSGKGGKRRAVPCARHVAHHLTVWLLERPETLETALLVHPDGPRRGHPASGNTLNDRLKRLVLRAELDRPASAISLHGLRHAVATHLLARGMDAERVRDFLGHRSLDTTQRYARIEESGARS